MKAITREELHKNLADLQRNLREEQYRNLTELHKKMDLIMRAMPRFISRQQVIREIGETELVNAIKIGFIKPLKGRAANSRVLIERSEYERYLEYMKQ